MFSDLHFTCIYFIDLFYEPFEYTPFFLYDMHKCLDAFASPPLVSKVSFVVYSKSSTDDLHEKMTFGDTKTKT